MRVIRWKTNSDMCVAVLCNITSRANYSQSSVLSFIEHIQYKNLSIYFFNQYSVACLCSLSQWWLFSQLSRGLINPSIAWFVFPASNQMENPACITSPACFQGPHTVPHTSLRMTAHVHSCVYAGHISSTIIFPGNCFNHLGLGFMKNFTNLFFSDDYLK